MPNLSRQADGPDGLYLKVGGVDASITITKDQIKAKHEELLSGDVPTTKERVVSFFCLLVSDALGAANVGPSQITFDYDPATGVPTGLTVTS